MLLHSLLAESDKLDHGCWSTGGRTDTIPSSVTRSLFGVIPALVGRSDGQVLADVLRGLSDQQQRRAFLRTARTVIDWRGQTVSATRQLGLLSDVPLLVAWGTGDKTIPPRHHLALAERVPHAVTVEIAGAGHYPHETAPVQLLSAMQTFLAATQPFRYSDDRWLRLLTQPPADDADTRTAEQQVAERTTSPESG